MTTIYEYLLSGLLLEDLKESKKIRVRAPQYKLIKGSLYKKSFLTSWLRCISPSQADNICCKDNSRLHTMPRTIYGKESIRKGCNSGWKHMAIQPLGSQHPRTLIASPQKIEIHSHSRGALHQVGRRKAFNNDEWKASRKVHMGTHSIQVREQIEIMNHIEKQLIRSQQGWADDLARVLWVHRTLPRNSQNETPFSLAYGSEAIIPSSEYLTTEGKRCTTKENAKRK
ncbi:reverse transcriptase domain-containing protein [Tanacetum coccineum]